jgi:hypothetical protein
MITKTKTTFGDTRQNVIIFDALLATNGKIRKRAITWALSVFH